MPSSRGVLYLWRVCLKFLRAFDPFLGLGNDVGTVTSLSGVSSIGISNQTRPMVVYSKWKKLVAEESTERYGVLKICGCIRC